MRLPVTLSLRHIEGRTVVIDLTHGNKFKAAGSLRLWYHEQVMINALTFDLEDWFCVSNLSPFISRNEWDLQEQRAYHNTKRILSLLKRYDTRATFFILGWIAERLPELIRDIDSEGHEIATHGYSHRVLSEMTAEDFDRDIARSIEIIRPLIREDIIGFRAPTFSIRADTLWALNVLKKHGIIYDSSVFPISFIAGSKGIPNLTLAVFRHTNGIIEFPLSCAEVLFLRVPCSGGCFFRLFPYNLTRHLLRRVNRDGRPFIFYLHPWEIDPDQPRMKMPFIDSMRHYTNLDRTYGRLERLLQDFQFTSIRKVLGI